MRLAVWSGVGMLVVGRRAGAEEVASSTYWPSYAPTLPYEYDEMMLNATAEEGSYAPSYNPTVTPSPSWRTEAPTFPKTMPPSTGEPTWAPTTWTPSTAAPTVTNYTYAPTYKPTANRTWFKKGAPSKDCDWVAALVKRCGVKGWDDTLAAESCAACGGSLSPSLAPTYSPTTANATYWPTYAPTTVNESESIASLTPMPSVGVTYAPTVFECPVVAAVDPDDCPDLGDLEGRLANCSENAWLATGDYCAGDGGCGTSVDLDNCDGAYTDIYLVESHTRPPTGAPSPLPTPLPTAFFSGTPTLKPSPVPTPSYWFKQGEPSKDCDWVADQVSDRCNVLGDTLAYAFEDCDACSGTASPTAVPSIGPTGQPTAAPTVHGLDILVGLQFDNFTLARKTADLELDDEVADAVAVAMASSVPRVVVARSRVTSVVWDEKAVRRRLRMLRKRGEYADEDTYHTRPSLLDSPAALPSSSQEETTTRRSLEDAGSPPFGAVYEATVSFAMSEVLLERLNVSNSTAAVRTLVASEVKAAALDGSIAAGLNVSDPVLAAAFLANSTATSINVAIFGATPTAAPTTSQPSLKPTTIAPTTAAPTAAPTKAPTEAPTFAPTTAAQAASSTGGSSSKKKSKAKTGGMDTGAFIALMILVALVFLICCFLVVYFATRKAEEDDRDEPADTKAPLHHDKDDGLFSSHEDPDFWPDEDKGIEMGESTPYKDDFDYGRSGATDTTRDAYDDDYDDPNDPHRSHNPVHSMPSVDDYDDENSAYSGADVEADLDGNNSVNSGHYVPHTSKDYITDSEAI